MAGSLTRRALAASALLALPRAARATAPERLGFDDLYAAWSVMGLRFSDRVKAMAGQQAVMTGFMAPPLKADGTFFVLTREPMSLCPFCSTDAEWPADIVVAYLKAEVAPSRFDAPIEVVGRLEIGSWTDPETGFVSQLRLQDAHARRL